MSQKNEKNTGSSALPRDVEIHRQDLVWDGFVKFYVTEATVKTKENKALTLKREVHDHGDVAAVLPIDLSRKTALLISQWRIPVWLNGHKSRLWETVAGIMEPGEDPMACGKREIMEETGYDVANLEFIREAFSSPGLVTERFYLYFGHYTPEDKKSDIIGLEHEGEDILLQEFTFDEIFTMAHDGTIVDSKTLLAIWALERKVSHK